MIVLLHAPDPAFVKEASKRGVFAHISDDDVEEWQSSIDIVLRSFAEFHELQGAFGRRALTERAKGILMERHSIDEDGAFEMLRESSRTDNRKPIHLAAAVVDGHHLLPKHPRDTPQPSPCHARASDDVDMGAFRLARPLAFRRRLVDGPSRLRIGRS